MKPGLPLKVCTLVSVYAVPKEDAQKIYELPLLTITPAGILDNGSGEDVDVSPQSVEDTAELIELIGSKLRVASGLGAGVRTCTPASVPAGVNASPL